MANSILHAIGTPIYAAKYTVIIPYLDADGDPTDPGTPDTEVSLDGGAFADCTNEVTTISGSNGVGYITLTGDEMTAQVVVVAAKVSTGPKATLMVIYPQIIVPTITSAGAEITSQTSPGGGDTTHCLLASDPGFNPIGCWLQTFGGTGGGGGGGCLNNQARPVIGYSSGTFACAVPTLETAWDNTTVYGLYLPPNTLTSMAFPTAGGRVR